MIIVLILLIIVFIAIMKANNELGKRIGYRAAALLIQPIATIILVATIFVLIIVLAGY
ncbi:hypothetical protein H6A19_14255 [Clostridium saudiense]|uniref:ABC transporter permease n=1 Tax=Clostridium saudiense TaxID=1414720 RepID=A0ABS2FKI8_9CLOT|nr:hypothetical protein [Clostridium saudiense]MBM6820481.1 hypothetical protein [Clostridium saudiense]